MNAYECLSTFGRDQRFSDVQDCSHFFPSQHLSVLLKVRACQSTRWPWCCIRDCSACMVRARIEVIGEAFFTSVGDGNLKWSMWAKRWVKWARLDLERLLQMLHLSPVLSPVLSHWLLYRLCTCLCQWRDLVWCSKHTCIQECLHLTDYRSAWKVWNATALIFFLGFDVLTCVMFSRLFFSVHWNDRRYTWELKKQETETPRKEFSFTRQQNPTHNLLRTSSDWCM